jgi:predicted alpha/beta-fold hydrolase
MHIALMPATPLVPPHPGPGPFRPARWLRSPHLQTLWAALIRRPATPAVTRERFETHDGDFLDLDWIEGGEGPIVIVLHGLEGSSRSPYAQGLAGALVRLGWRAVVMHFRGCSGTPNRLDRSYHSGETGDLGALIEHLRRREPAVPLLAVGFSLGGNALLKWLGEQGRRAPLTAAVAVSVPFLLDDAARRLEQGFSRLYQWWLMRSLIAKLRGKFRDRPAPVDFGTLRAWHSMRRFDETVTAPLHGFAGAADYYARSSSRAYLSVITVPTLVLHARDDPFMTEAALPRPEEVSGAVSLEICPHGGHVGFVGGAAPWRARYWLDERIPAFLAARIADRDPGPVPPASPPS